MSLDYLRALKDNVIHDYCKSYAACDCIQDSSAKDQQDVQDKCMFNVASMRKDNYDGYMGHLGGYLAYNFENPTDYSSCNGAEQAKIIATKDHKYPWCRE
jgi:hypothetical protein